MKGMVRVMTGMGFGVGKHVFSFLPFCPALVRQCSALLQCHFYRTRAAN